MQRSLVSEIYGYAVCLLAIVVAFAALAGTIHGAFGIARPAPGPTFFVQHRGPFGQMPAPPPKADVPFPDAMDAGPPPQLRGMRERVVAGARFDGAAHLTTSLIVLLAAGGLFFWHWRWLHEPARAAAS
ncbi:MAG: hypothetical protein JOZ38_03985 [Candidatus Eremiobacteraeota bacterium]|nr:hypothetical protein [Candidatus Eremiobacteraeota bacterium]